MINEGKIMETNKSFKTTRVVNMSPVHNKQVLIESKSISKANHECIRNAKYKIILESKNNIKSSVKTVRTDDCNSKDIDKFITYSKFEWAVVTNADDYCPIQDYLILFNAKSDTNAILDVAMPEINKLSAERNKKIERLLGDNT